MTSAKCIARIEVEAYDDGQIRIVRSMPGLIVSDHLTEQAPTLHGDPIAAENAAPDGFVSFTWEMFPDIHIGRSAFGFFLGFGENIQRVLSFAGDSLRKNE